MAFSPQDEQSGRYWRELLSEYPELAEGLESLREDPEADVVAAVGIFTMLKIRLLHYLPGNASDTLPQGHHSDDAPPPQAGGKE